MSSKERGIRNGEVEETSRYSPLGKPEPIEQGTIETSDMGTLRVVKDGGQSADGDAAAVKRVREANSNRQRFFFPPRK